MIEKVIYFNRLFDYYGNLLTERQQEVFRYYYREDYSYQEIADLLGISRAAVYDNLKRASQALEDYENRLQFAKRIERLIRQLEALDDLKIKEILDDFHKGGSF